MDWLDDYECYECGTKMVKADDTVLVCPKCGHSVDIDDYTTEAEDYEEFYGSHSKYDSETYWYDNEEFPEEFPGETHEEVYGNSKKKKK